MNDQDKSREQLLAELDNVRQRVGELEAQLARSQPTGPDQWQIHDHLPLLIATASLDGYYKEVNAAFERILGWSEQESLARPFLDFIHPDDRAAAVEALGQLRAGNPAINFLDRNVCKDGSHRWISWNVIPVPDRDIVFGIGQDLTQQKLAEDERNRAEAALRESEERFRKIFEEGPLSIVLASLDGRVQSVNRRFCDLLGYSEREIIELGIDGISQPDDNRVDEQLVARLRRGEIPRYTMEKRFIRKDGQLRWGELTVSLMHDAEGQPTYAIGMTVDITERKQAEAALRESERRLSTLLSNLPGAVYRCKADANWTVEFLSDGYLPLTGHEPSQLIGQPGTCHSEFIHPDDRQREFDAMQEAIAQKRQYQVEYRVRTATGQEKWVWEQGIGIFSDSGELEAIEGFTTDITDRKRVKEELRKANERLEQRVAERTADLTQANERLQAEVQQRRAAEEKLAIFRRFVEAATQGFGMAGVDGRLIYANPFLARLLGAPSQEDIVGKHVAAYYPAGYGEHRERVILPALRRKEPWQGEQMMVFPDGKVHPTVHTIFPVLDDHGELFCTAAVITDITELKQTQERLRQTCEELRASQERFELVVRAAGTGIFDWDSRTGRVYYSPRWKELLGYEEHEIGEGFEDWASRLHPEERAWIIRRQDDFLAGTSPTAIATEYRLRHKDGSYRWVMAHAVAVRDSEGKAYRLVGSHVDITDRKLAAEKLRHEQRALRRMVQASDRERRVITYDLHDGVAQQLLGAMFQFESLEPRRGRKPKAAEAYREGMDGLRHAAAELRRVMNWLRTPVLDKYGLTDGIADIVSQLRLMPGAPDIEYFHDVQFVRLEPILETFLFRIAQEALTNACRHSQSKKVRVTLTQNGGEVTLEVRDWGIGFDQDAVQEDHFGLEGIRERTRILGGKLSIQSEPGKGTVIRVVFPVMEATGQE